MHTKRKAISYARKTVVSEIQTLRLVVHLTQNDHPDVIQISFTKALRKCYTKIPPIRAYFWASNHSKILDFSLSPDSKCRYWTSRGDPTLLRQKKIIHEKKITENRAKFGRTPFPATLPKTLPTETFQAA